MKHKTRHLPFPDCPPNGRTEHPIPSVNWIRAAARRAMQNPNNPNLLHLFKARLRRDGKLKRTSPTQRRHACAETLDALIFQADVETWQAAVPVEEIANKAGMNRRRISDALLDLRMAGIIPRIGKPKDAADPFIRRRAPRVCLRRICKNFLKDIGAWKWARRLGQRKERDRHNYYKTAPIATSSETMQNGVKTIAAWQAHYRLKPT